MARVEIDTQRAPGRIVGGWGARIKVDGRELREVRNIDVACHLDGVVSVSVEMLVTELFSLNADATVAVTAIVLPGFRLIEESVGDGSTKVYRAEVEDGKQ